MWVVVWSRTRHWLLIGGLFLLLGWISGMYIGSVGTIPVGLSQWVLVIDPGHGGVDGGTQDAAGNLEKNINLAMALRLKAQLLQSGIQVIMTRETDTALDPYGKPGRHQRDLNRRIAIARNQHCLYLISIHCDWSKDTHKTGPSVFYYAASPESQQLAEKIQGELNSELGTTRKAAPAKFWVLRQSGINAVLVEIGLLSNLENAKLLQTPAYQERLAVAIMRGILFRCRQTL